MTYLVVKTCKVLEVPDGDEPSRADSIDSDFTVAGKNSDGT
jgi:hypothetical protein